MCNIKRAVFTGLGIFTSMIVLAQSDSTRLGHIVSENGNPIIHATIKVKNYNTIIFSDKEGNFLIPNGISTPIDIEVHAINFKPQNIIFSGGTISMSPYNKDLEPIEIFGRSNKQPDKLEALTALPLNANEQIQSVSVISNRLIREQDNQDISEALRNVTGVSLSSTFGGMTNTYDIRGIRGVTTLINGIQMNNDFRGHGITPDMETIDNIQVLKGSSAVAQGVSNSIGAVGGIINAVTKTPNFINSGTVGIRYSSWENVRGIFDIERVLNNQFSLRVNGAAQAGNGYRPTTKNNRFVINPSFEWRPDNNTRIIGELHYQHDSRTPDRGTVNLGADSVNGLYNIPTNKFIGFSTDYNLTDAKFWGLRLIRRLSDKLEFKINYYGSTYKQDFNSSIAALDSSYFKTTGDRNHRYRYMNRITENDKSNVINLAFIGHDISTGSIKHTFQFGFDYRRRDWYSQAFNSKPIDTIDVLASINNTIPSGTLSYTENLGRYYNRYYSDYGLYGQDMITFNKFLRALLGVRYSHTNSIDNKTMTYASGHGIDPIIGLFITPVKGLNFFGSYTTVSDISTAEYIDENGKKLGNSMTRQYEFGLKSNYFKDRLRFNFTYFIMNNNDYAYQLTNTATGNVYYNQSGSLKRHGIETEIAGHVLSNLEVMLGYTHLNATYNGVKSYVDGSAPLGAAKDLANGWVNYLFNRGTFKGLSLGLGYYYVGKRPVDDYTKATSVNLVTGGSEIQKITPGTPPFDLADYTTINAQISYNYKQYTLRMVMNNIGNSRGYTAYYPQAFLNPTDPRNFGISFFYSF